MSLADLVAPFRPDLRARRVVDVDRKLLAERGVRGVILDLDNTLTRWHAGEIPTEVRDWVGDLREGGMRFCILSNALRYRRVARLAEVLDLHWVPHAGKPRASGFRRAMQAMGVTPTETAMIGDQLLTDIWGGNRAGCLTILVEPISSVEFVGTRLVHRPLERLLLAAMDRSGVQHHWLPGGAAEGRR